MTLFERLPIALVIVAVGLVADHVAAGNDRRIFSVPLAEGQRAKVAYGMRFVRPSLILMMVANTSLALVARWPIVVFGAAYLHVMMSTMQLQIAARSVARRLASEAAPQRSAKSLSVPLTVFPHQPNESFLRLFSVPLQIFHAAILVLGCFFFQRLLPYLPSVAPIGPVGAIVSPTTLWWSLIVPAFNTTLMLLVAWGVSKEHWRTSSPQASEDAEQKSDAESEETASEVDANADSSEASDVRLLSLRRALLVRFVEVLLVSMNFAALIMWSGASLGLAVGVQAGLVGRVGLWVAAFVLVTLIYCFVRYFPALARIRHRLGDRVRPGARDDAYSLGGIIYFAKDDPALFVPKKGSYGSTLNFGRPAAWLFVLILVAGPLAFAWALGR